MADTDVTNGKPKLIPQPHGGAIYGGGVPGNRGGPGRPPSELRARMRGTLEERFAVIEQILDDPAATSADKIRCLDLLAKYGLGTKHELSGANDEPVITIDAETLRADLVARHRRIALPAADADDA